MPISGFIGSDLALQSLLQISLASLRVRFLNDPLTSDRSGVNDALNPAQYTITGPGVNTVISVSVVPEDPQAVDLTFASPFVSGLWTLSVSPNLQMADGRSLQPPFSMDFNTIYTANISPVSGGSKNDDSASIIRKHLNSLLKGPVWNALIAATATGDDTNSENARLIFNQLFKLTASGLYLDRLCADDGVDRPLDTGMSDELFGKYAVKITNRKLTQQVLLEILEVFYGSDSVRSSVESGNPGPYSLTSGMTLDLLFNGNSKESVKITFTDSDFSTIGSCSAVEVAATITRSCQSQHNNAFAVAVDISGKSVIRIYSSSLGLTSAVQVVGGTSQSVFRFPLPLDVTTGSVSGSDNYSWIANVNNNQDNTLFTLTVIPPCKVDLSKVQTGDWVIVNGLLSGMPDGVYQILDASIDYSGESLVQTFTVLGNVLSGLLVNSVTAVQMSELAYQFFRPERHTIQKANSRTPIVCQRKITGLDISVPATTQAVARQVNSAAYLNDGEILDISGLGRTGNTVYGTSESIVLPGDLITVTGSIGNGILPAVTLLGYPNTSCSKASLWVGLLPQDFPITQKHTLERSLLNGYETILRIGGAVSGVATFATDRWSINAGADSGYGKSYMYSVLGGPSMNTARHSHVSLTIPSGINAGAVYVFGGLNSSSACLDSIEKLDYGGTVWTTLTSAMTQAAVGHTVAFIDQYTVLTFGGYSSYWNSSLDWITEFDLTKDTRSNCHMLKNRQYHTSVVLQNGKVLLCGGLDYTPNVLLNHCEVYDPDTRTSTQVGSMGYRRQKHKCILLPDGRVLCIGGEGYRASSPNNRVPIAAMEVFDPGTEQWSPAGVLQEGLIDPVVGLLPGCNLIVVAYGIKAGGVYGSSYHAQYFDAKTLKSKGYTLNPWTAVSQGRIEDPVGIVLSDDRIFVNGGVASGGNPESVLFVHGLDSISGQGMNGTFPVDLVGEGGFSYKTETSGYAVAKPGAVITKMKAKPGVWNGPYIFDPDVGIPITKILGGTTVELSKGRSYSEISISLYLDETASPILFPNTEGWLCFGFGTEYSCGPVKYFGWGRSESSLQIDGAFKFPKTLPTGTSISLLSQKGSYDPANPEELGSFYLTNSPAGLNAAKRGIMDVVAGGIPVDITVIYPSDVGLGNAGYPIVGDKVSDKVKIWG